MNAPKAESAKPMARILYFPKLSMRAPEGISTNILEMNHAEETNPIRNSEGFSSRAKMDKKAEGRPIVNNSNEAEAISSK